MEPEMQNVGEVEKKSHGAFIGSVIIVLIIILGGIYIWQSKVKTVLEESQVTTEDQEELENLEEDLSEFEVEFDSSFDSEINGLE